MRKRRILLILIVVLSVLVGCGLFESDKDSDSSKEQTTSSSHKTKNKKEKKDKKDKKNKDKEQDKDEEEKVVDPESCPEFDLVQDFKAVYTWDDTDVTGYMSVTYLQLKDSSAQDYPNLEANLYSFNEESRKKFEADMADFTEESRSFYDQMPTEDEGFDFERCYDYRDITVTRADKDVTSFFVRNSNYLGSHEPAESYTCVNLDSVTGLDIEFSDIVADESGFEKALETLYEEKFGVPLTVYGDVDPSTYDWCLTPIGINVYFPKEYPETLSVSGNYLGVGFDAYPELFTEKYRPENDDYVYPLNTYEDLYVDIDNDGSVNKVSFGVIVPEGAEGSGECEGYTISVDDTEYDDFGENWFYEWQPYYVHTSDGAYIYAYLTGYENNYIDVVKLDESRPSYEKTLVADNLYSKQEPGRGDIYRFRANAFTSSQILLKRDFATDVCGEYMYMPVVSSEDEEGMGEWSFEIYDFDGKYYIEELSDYYYGAGEIELLSDTPTPCDDGYSYRIKIHYFSGFAFAGDYQGSGYECDLIVHEDGSIVLTKGQPFDQGDEIILFPYRDNPIHYMMNDIATENLDCPAVIGAWRFVGTDENNEAFENYFELRPNGTAVLVSKTDTRPPVVTIGAYQVFNLSDMHEATITFSGEIMGYACQPSEEMEFSYDTSADILTFAPFGYDDSDSVMEYYRASKGMHAMNIAPGPGSREDEVISAWEEYYSFE